MFEILKNKSYDIVFSIVLGIGLIALLKPGCKGGICSVKKAPNMDEIQESTYQIGTKCYQFHSTPIDCPASGVIEPFE